MKRYHWQPDLKNIPTDPGVYRFLLESSGQVEVLYVGKAKNLRNRLSSYFQEPSLLQPRTFAMISQATSVIWTLVNNETEAFQLEHSLIQEFKPKYNIRFRDDKSYPYICITVNDDVPRVFSTRRRNINGARYFGPYPNSQDVRTSIELLTKVFPVRTCSPTVFKNHQRQNRACLLGHIDRCSAPCLSSSDVQVNHANANFMVDFLEGDDDQVVEQLAVDMTNASESEQFEEAAKLRDRLTAIKSILEKSAVSIERELSADFIGMASTDLDLVTSLIQVRNGRVVGEERVFADIVIDAEPLDLLTTFILHRYSNQTAMPPKEIYVSGFSGDLTQVESALRKILNRRIAISIPKRGEKLRIGQLALKNAESAIALQKQSVLSNLASRSKALQELSESLGLDQPPLRIECVDVSHLQGTSRVAAVVVFEDGMPNPSEYRSYVLQTPGDDLAGIREVISRRIKVFNESRSRYPIGLLVIDGGPWQALAAREVLDANGVDIPTVGLAKRLEEIWWPGGKSPLVLPRDSTALYLLQQLRDETHRRAISHHRKRRGKQAVASILDEIEGIGPERRKLLLRHFGGSTGLRAASIEEISMVRGIGASLAKNIYAELHAMDGNLPEFEQKGE